MHLAHLCLTPQSMQCIGMFVSDCLVWVASVSEQEDKHMQSEELQLFCRAKLSLDAALAALVGFNLALALLCVAFMARRVNTSIFSWLTSSISYRPKLVRLRSLSVQCSTKVQATLQAPWNIASELSPN